MDITNSKSDLLVGFALNMWANYIETGDVNLSALDAEKVGKSRRTLSAYQMASVIRLRQMSKIYCERGL